jgi:hypothetical protein
MADPQVTYFSTDAVNCKQEQGEKVRDTYPSALKGYISSFVAFAKDWGDSLGRSLGGREKARDNHELHLVRNQRHCSTHHPNPLPSLQIRTRQEKPHRV